MINTKKCLICKEGRKNDCLHWHIDSETGDIWVWCQGKCQRGYSIYAYCHQAGISLNEFLKGDFDFVESKPNEVTKMEWPTWYVTLSDPRAAKGVEYIKTRGLKLEGDMYYDMEHEGIVFPYYVNNVFVGAQIRYIKSWTDKDGAERKIDTIPGTRLGLVFYNWNQEPFVTDIKGVIVTEGAFNALAIQQSLNQIFGGISRSPWRVVACSGSGATRHQKETLRELKEQGVKIIAAPDSDEAGLAMLAKFKEADSITHYALTMDSVRDWNDFLKTMGHEKFAKWFLSSVKPV
jgi:hypothetical protein